MSKNCPDRQPVSHTKIPLKMNFSFLFYLASLNPPNGIASVVGSDAQMSIFFIWHFQSEFSVQDDLISAVFVARPTWGGGPLSKPLSSSSSTGSRISAKDVNFFCWKKFTTVRIKCFVAMFLINNGPILASFCSFQTRFHVWKSCCRDRRSRRWARWPLPGPWSYLVEGDERYIGPSGKLLCLWQPPKIMQHIHAWQHSILAWLLGRSGCSSPTIKELHAQTTSAMAFHCSVLNSA